MLTKYSDVVIDSSGNGIAGVLVSVTIAGVTTAAVLYTDKDGQSPVVGNVITTSSTPAGTFSFFVPEGHYDLTCTKDGVLIATKLNVYVPSSSVPVVNPLRFMTAAQLKDVLDGTVLVDASSGLQACVDYAQANDLAVDLQGLKYRVGANVVWRHGRNGTTDTKGYTVNIIGNGATLYPAAGVCPINVVPRCTLADKTSGRGEAVIKIRDLTIDGFLSPSSAKAISIGAAGMVCSAFEWSDIDGLTIQGFASGNTVVTLTDTRHIDFERFTIRAGTMAITCATAGGFCGDFVFTASEFAGSEASPPLNITVSSGGQVRGLHFGATDIYGAGTLINASGSGSQVGDIWFEDGTQFDGPDAAAGERALILQATNNGQLFQIHSKGTYFVGYSGAVIDGTTSTGGTIRILSIEGGGVNDCSGDAASGNSIMNFEALEQLAVRGVNFDNCTADQLLNVDACEHVVVHDNQAVGCNADYLISIGNGNKHSIIANVAEVNTAVVNDYTSGSPTRQSANNLLV